MSRERGIGLNGAPPAAGSRTWSALVFAIHAAVFAGLLAWSWRKWPDPIIDFGRELYVAWQITEGRVLYRDLATLFGPLSPYVNAFWFRMFGVSLTTLVACNLAIFALLLAGIYRFVGRCADRVAAAAATLSVLLLCGFSQYVEIGNYNFVTPYAHEATHGLAIGIGLLLCLANGVRTGSRLRSWAAAGICFGLIVLTKPETAIAALAAVVTAVAGRAVVDRGDARRATGVTLVFFGCASIPPIGFFAYFLDHMPALDALRATAGAWVFTIGRGIERSPFYIHGMGLDHPVANVVRLLVSFAGIAVFIAAAAIVTRRSPGPADTTMLRRVQQVTLVIAGIGLAQTGMLFAALPLVVASVLIASGVLVWRAREDRSHAMRFLCLAIWSVFALVLLAKMGLNARVVQYGFYLAVPGIVVMVVALAWLVPQAIDRWNGTRAARTVRAMALCTFVGAIAPYLVIANMRYQAKTLAVGEGADRILTNSGQGDWQGPAVNAALADLAASPGSSLAVMPEGVMLNYLSRRPSPLRVINLMPPEMMAFGEADILRSLEMSPPDTVVLIHRNVAEYGVPIFGSGERYGGRILGWVMSHYRPVRVIGHNPLDEQGSGLVILRRSS